MNILVRILESEGNFNGSADAIITADGFILFMSQEFGFWLLGSSDRGSQRSPGNLTFSLLCARCHAVEKMTRNSDAVHSSFCKGSFLAGDMANPPPASPHQDGSHWFGSRPFKKIFVGNDIRPKDA